jgi:hypothetical protein
MNPKDRMAMMMAGVEPTENYGYMSGPHQPTQEEYRASYGTPSVENIATGLGKGATGAHWFGAGIQGSLNKDEMEQWRLQEAQRLQESQQKDAAYQEHMQRNRMLTQRQGGG